MTTIWIIIALVCFILPSVALTSGGKKAPAPAALEKYAADTGLPLTDEVAAPLVERIRRRERGMLTGGLIGLVIFSAVLIFTDASDQLAPLIIALTAAGTAFGGAWMLATPRPSPRADAPVVARARSTRLSDYLTPGERFGFFILPVALLVSIAAGYGLFSMIPEAERGNSFLFGFGGVLIALATWWISAPLMFKVIDAPVRSGTDLELAWDDAERAIGLRRLANLVIVVGCIAISFWLALIAEVVTTDGFYRAPETQELTWTITGLALLIFGALIIAVAVRPVLAWLTGEREGYEQRQLWGAAE